MKLQPELSQEQWLRRMKNKWRQMLNLNRTCGKTDEPTTYDKLQPLRFKLSVLSHLVFYCETYKVFLFSLFMVNVCLLVRPLCLWAGQSTSADWTRLIPASHALTPQFSFSLSHSTQTDVCVGSVGPVVYIFGTSAPGQASSPSATLCPARRPHLSEEIRGTKWVSDKRMARRVLFTS